jgi:hypothetical protein
MKFYLILTLSLLTGNLVAQNASKKVIDKSCGCLNNEKTTVKNYDEFMSLIVKCVSPNLGDNLQELKTEFGITEKDLMKSMEMIGEKIGEQMVYDCPKFAEMTMKLLGEDKEFQDLAIEELSKESNASERLAEDGTITTVDIASFPCQLSIQTEGGETINVLWLDEITMDQTYVENPSKLKGKKIQFVYEMRKLYDPKLKKYVSKKVLLEMNF